MDYRVLYGTGNLGVRPIYTNSDDNVGQIIDQALTLPSKTASTILYTIKTLDPTLPFYLVIGPKL